MRSDENSKRSTQSTIAGNGLTLTLQPEQDDDPLESALMADYISADYAFRSHRLMALGELVAGVTHNFGNVLMCVSATLELLQMRMAAHPELAQYAISIEDVLDRVHLAGQLSQRLLEFAGEASPEITDTDVRAVVDRSLSLCVIHPQAKRVELINDVPHNALPVRVDAMQLQEVVTNLVLNALQASDGGRIRVRMDVRGDGLTEISVADQGCGIPSEDIPRIFQPFFTKRKNGEQGTGLGLSCCLNQVRAMGGTIEVQSSPGQGSTFRVILPTQSQSQTDIDDDVSPAGSI